MNLVDVLIVLLVIASVARGYRIGLARQAGSTIGFVFGLFVGSWVSNLFLGHINGAVSKSLTSLLIVLLGGFIFMTVGEIVGIRAKYHLTKNNSLNTFDGGLGSVMAIATVLFAAWLFAAILVLGPTSDVQQTLKNSRILSSLNSHLPPATSFLSSLNKLIDPNGFPQVFRGLEPSPTDTDLPSLGRFDPVIASTKASVVRVEGAGCGGIVEGTGFMISKDRIATNAHVVAGVKAPKVTDQNGLHDTRVVWFNPDLDLAVLQVSGLAGKPLPLNTTEQNNGTPGVIMGFPGGGGFDVQAAAVMDRFLASGRNIYGEGNTVRDVYAVRGKVIPGNSGGPMVGSDGSVLGVVFATSTTYSRVGYVLTGSQVAPDISAAIASNTTRDTGSCSE